MKKIFANSIKIIVIILFTLIINFFLAIPYHKAFDIIFFTPKDIITGNPFYYMQTGALMKFGISFCLSAFLYEHLHNSFTWKNCLKYFLLFTLLFFIGILIDAYSDKF